MSSTRRWRALTGLHSGEGAPAAMAGAMFFCLMAAYFIVKPLRDEMGIAGGVDNLPNLYLVTLGVMLLAAPLFGWASRGRDREVFLPVVYRFFAANLLAFFLVLQLLPGADLWIGRVFYVWVGVFNMFTLSLFWGFMADGLGFRRGRRVIGAVAVGGTAGAVLGASMTELLVALIGRLPLLLVSVAFLEAAVRLVGPVSRRLRALPREGQTPDAAPPRAPRHGHIMEGVILLARSPYLQAIAAFMVLYTLSNTFLYLAQANIVAATADGRIARTQLLARIEIYVQTATLVTQLTLTGRALTRAGSGPVLAALPVATGAGFLALGVHPGLAVLVAVQVLRRTLNYALVKPARESLYTPLGPAAQYRAKSFIDTFVYRGGDAVGAGVYDGLTTLGLGISGVAFAAAPLCLVWLAVAVYLGRRQRRLADGVGPRDAALGAPGIAHREIDGSTP
jgi:AAA family ATP:ADP antiporter